MVSNAATKTRLELPDEARVMVITQLGVPFAFAAIGRGEKTQILAHGYGKTSEEALTNMELCKPKARKRSVAKT